MDHPCEKCGHPVEDGVPFCPHCRAPQIRVVMPEGGESGFAFGDAHARPTARPNSILWSLALPVCASAGILAGVLMAITDPLALWMLTAGFLTVVFYHRRNPLGRISARIGARLGGAAGVIAMAVFLGAATYNGHLRALFGAMVEAYLRLKSDPNFKDLASRGLELMKQPAGTAIFVTSICSTIFTLFILGGALGGALLGRRRK